ncbi:SDR family NAD(P)-dependent oxidoreductase [Stenotrophomonas sp. BIO128-Bstrain]|uniref:SDR family NAD(P)-dependent oxidoreductase n=1 Tax=Stenotrophomonas sp. BIO128-Bstrain TaxID=3027225 RepID=UPI0024DE9FC0|nr:SDR family NAD(P)-dependent oxidoreductase [Stenotrophomonas sp. BIO128-Bstrain]WIA62588.1 SDR family NAD(P)-dependent oxidoreductase [Stenotrophomonas sp. BIO128-Bstrain]
MSKEISFENKVIVVTGSGRGLGRAYAVEFARRGAKVVINDFGGSRVGEGSSTTPAEEAVAELLALGAEAVANYDDISQEAGAANLIKAAIDAFGRIDVIVNNAGIAGGWPLLESPNELFERFWRVHLLGSVNVTRAAWPYFIKQGGGRVVNITSEAAMWGMVGQAVYGSAKGAVNGLTKVLALEGAPFNIAVNAIAPAAYTRMQAEVITDPVHSEFARKSMTAELVVPAIVFLAHESAKVNGQIFGAYSGRVGRVITGAVPGYYDANMTVETLRDNWDVAVGGVEDVLIPAELLEAGPLLTEAAMKNRENAPQ